MAYWFTGMVKESAVTEYDFNYSATCQLNSDTKNWKVFPDVYS
jgi:hypothetical protein